MRVDRRTVLKAAVAVPLLSSLPQRAFADDWAGATHGLSAFGDLKYAPDFKSFAYVNPDAPKGGSFSQMGPTSIYNQSFQTFNSLNIFILAGDGAQGMELCFDSLMVRAFDEPDALYGLVAEKVLINGRDIRVKLRSEAKFSDGSPLTAADVAWSFATLVEKGHPLFRQTVGTVEKVDAVGPNEVHIVLPENHSRDLLNEVMGLPILSKTYYDSHDFTAVTLDPPLGSGPYTVSNITPGRTLELTRNPAYWAKDLAVTRGQYNFDTIRFELFRDRAAGLQAFKAREYEFREEFTSRAWATDYTFPEITDGRVKRDEIPDGTISGGQGWYFNLRRAAFKDRRIREAIQLAFDFEWSNKSLFFGSYKRSHSLFQGANFMASGMPTPEELAILEPFRAQLTDLAFGEAVLMPQSDGSGEDRKQLAKANALLLEAGCTRQGTQLLLPDGAPFTLEFLDDDESFKRVVEPYIGNLKRLGIAASHRIVDGPQYQERVKRFDFDVVATRQSVSPTPGEELKSYFGTEAAKIEGSRNLAGISDPVVDALVTRILGSKTRTELDLLLKVLDRVVRAQRYWVPQWYKGTHWIAYWNVFARPDIKPTFDRGVLSTWWHDAERDTLTAP